MRAGKGVTIVAVAHGLGQLREGWGPDGAATIWDTTNKIILPGVTDRDCLQVRARMAETGENYTTAPGWSSPGVYRASRRWRCGCS